MRIMKIIAVERNASTQARSSSRRHSLPKAAAIAQAPKAPSAAASVGVATPV